MSNLLNKKNDGNKPSKQKRSSLLDKTHDPQPENVFSRQKLFTVDETGTRKELKVVKRKVTTIRCYQDTSQMVNLLVTVGGFESADELISTLGKHYIETLPPDQRMEYDTLLKLQQKKGDK